MKTLGILAIMAFVLVALAGVAIALPVEVVTKINDNTVAPDETIRQDVERNGEVDISVQLMSHENLENVEVKAFLSGYEYNDEERVSETTPLFDMEANVSYTKKLTLVLPDDVDEDDYKLRLVISDRYGKESTLNYNLKVDVPRHKLTFADISLSPGSRVNADSALIVNARLDNRGNTDEKNVEVTATIAELGVSDTNYINEIEYDEQEETEDLWLKLPKCAKPGIYTLEIVASYNRNHDSAQETRNIEVLANDACNVPAKPVTAPATTAPVVTTTQAAAQETGKSTLRTVLETVLLVLVALLVIIGLIIGFSKLKGDD